MNKKLIALALVLLIAVGGVFAVEQSVNPTAELKATILAFFTHGFYDGEENYKTGVSISDAFNTNTPILVYGFEAKESVAFDAMMTVTAFEHQDPDSSEVVGISKVLLDGVEAIKESGKYKILSYTAEEIGQRKLRSVNIKVIPVAEDVTNALPGDYISTITVEIKS